MDIITTENLTKFYGSERGIEGVSINVKQGDIFGFIGPNGAGKSTTIRTLLNLIFPSSGSSQIFGKDTVTESAEIKNKIGYLPSEVNYYDNMSVQDLLNFSATFFPNTDNKYRKELCERFALDTTREVNELSLGNRKKVAIVQALMHRPELLIMDEPTSGLDPLMQTEFHEVLKKANKDGTTLFFSSHILGDVQKICNRVSIIRNGVIEANEDIDSLLARQLKKVSLVLNDDAKEEQFAKEEISKLNLLHQRVSFTYSESPNELLRFIAQLEVKDLTIEEPTLEDIFMHYYE